MEGVRVVLEEHQCLQAMVFISFTATVLHMLLEHDVACDAKYRTEVKRLGPINQYLL